MAVSPSIGTKMTATAYLELPETMQRMELIDGEVIVPPAPELYHQDITGNVYLLARRLVKSGHVYMSPVDVHLDDHNVVQPDVLWIAPESACVQVNGKHLRGAPDFVAEVLSPGTARRDKKQKFALYEKHGTREYWLIDPVAQYVEVWALAGGKFERRGVYEPGDSFASILSDEQVVEVNALFA
jgi:Uma2 family endonuclease